MGARIIAITGGIGAGKSVVSRMLTAMGHDVYDCDSRAKALMDNSGEIKRRIAEEIAAEAVDGDKILRPVLAEIVFNNPDKLLILNSIVHQYVREDIAREAAGSDAPVMFIETAILYESGLDRMVSQVWDVTAPEPVRIERVVARNGCTADHARARIESQRIVVENPHHAVHTIVNDNITPLLPQVLHLLGGI
ncbi:MAG: dephospho-CoA kinase [Muribaculaceae bacterium]|nr:dephospho-CoA kinase [Muribaculaceae bacterium]